MAAQRPSSRKKILAAAAVLAEEAGPGSLSLDAVANRAGVSKGGLLYNFPSKAKLMQGLVEEYLAEFEAALNAATDQGESLISAYTRLSMTSCSATERPAAWIFAAMAEDPDFLAPINAFRRRLLDRLMAETSEATKLLITFLAVEGLRSMKLFGSNLFTDQERAMIEPALLAGRLP